MPNRIKIAIADDHTLLRNGLADLVDSFGPFKVILEAGTGRTLIDALLTADNLPEICILDVNMPDLDGFDTLVLIKKNWPEMKVLALSMFNSEFTIIKMLRNGANGYLLKNCEPNEFYTALLAVHQTGFYEPSGGGMQGILQLEKEAPHISAKEMEFLKWCCTEMV